VHEGCVAFICAEDFKVRVDDAEEIVDGVEGRFELLFAEPDFIDDFRVLFFPLYPQGLFENAVLFFYLQKAEQ
jgi:hypothetical protein